MNRYIKIFHKLRILNEGCFIPFLTIADPSQEIFYKIIDILIESGIDCLELGLPFSDPVADGIIVQNSHLRVLSNQISIIDCFNIIKNIRKKYDKIPIGILVYANIIFNQGIKNFFCLCKKHDIDSVLIPDVPIEESKIFEKHAKLNQICYIFICPPNAKEDTIKYIAHNSTGYIYLVSRSGVTGFKNQAIQPNKNIINSFKKYNSAPILQGFGISTEDQIKTSLLQGIHGVICGSKIIQIIQDYQNNIDMMLKNISYLIKKLKQSTRNLL